MEIEKNVLDKRAFPNSSEQEMLQSFSIGINTCTMLGIDGIFFGFEFKTCVYVLQCFVRLGLIYKLVIN